MSQEKLKAMGAKCGVSQSDCEKLYNNGLTHDNAERAAMHGIDLGAILALFNTYGPVFVNILNDILNRLKPVNPTTPAPSSQ